MAQSLMQGLTESGYSALVANTGEEACVMLLQQTPDLVLLDLNLPGRDGIAVLKIIRQHNREIPVLILTARDSIEDRVLGLDTGASDYLIKPFAFPELLARLRVLTRRDAQRILLYTYEDLEVDVVARQVKRAGRRINLAPREFEILEILLRHQGRPVSRQTIATDVWQVERATSLDNVIDVHIMRLRKKIDLPDGVPLIHTIRGLGFMLGVDADRTK